MSSRHGLKRLRYGVRSPSPWTFPGARRWVHSERQLPKSIHFDGRNRLSTLWAPAQRKSKGEVENDSHQLLLRAGFLRQAHSGIFHLLPLGLRVQDKIERLIDHHMVRIGASKVSLSSLSSQDLWQRSGRLQGRDSEFFRLEDRKEAKYLLAPTHEEEITTIVANAVHSYKDLPLRLYQVSRKYRDEARPRQGLLRGREFVMKDLYTFDVTESDARETYEQVRAAYCAFLDDLRMPYTVAKADSGNMGGKLSHEYHFVSTSGEDTIISCDSCDMVLNEELYTGSYQAERTGPIQGSSYRTWHGLTQDRNTLVNIYIPEGDHEVNIHAIKQLLPALDSAAQPSSETASLANSIVAFADPRLSPEALAAIKSDLRADGRVQPEALQTASCLLTRLQNDDPCPGCHTGSVKLSPAVEVGHTFHLGKRYSVPLDATVLDASNQSVAVEMGCHGIGVSRLVAAVASLLADDKGLNWPLPIAPFGAIMLGSGGTAIEDVNTVYDNIASVSGLDVAIDDRDRPVGWKLNDADLIGYPFIVVLGKAWAQRKAVELQCRRLGVKEEIPVGELVPKMEVYSRNL